MYENVQGGQLYYNYSIGANGVTHSTIKMHPEHRLPLSIISENIPFKFGHTSKVTAENSLSAFSQLKCNEKIENHADETYKEETYQNETNDLSERKLKRELKKFWRCLNSKVFIHSFEIFSNLQLLELKVFPLSLYLFNYNEITPNMRAILVEWMTDVSHTRRHSPETLFIAVNYLDRYLSSSIVDIKNLQLVGITCLFVASKLNDVKVPLIDEFAYVTENLYNTDNIIEAERNILSGLEFNLIVPTCLYFAEFYASYFNNLFQSSDTFLFMQSLCEFTLIEYQLCNSYYPSILAAAIILVVSSYRNSIVKLEDFNSFGLDLLNIINCYDSLGKAILLLNTTPCKSNLRRLKALWIKKETTFSGENSNRFR